MGNVAGIFLTMQEEMRSLALFTNQEGMKMTRMVKKKPARKVLKSKISIRRAKPTKTAKPLGPSVGASAPAFKMPATVVGEVSSAQLKGKPFVLYFYPKDDTSGCTAEACGFREVVPAFDKLGLTVIGVSKDSITSHEKFAKKHNLNFPLASDEAGKVCTRFGVWVKKSMYGRTYMGIERATFLVDAQGIIRHVWRKVSVPGHVDAVKETIKEL